MPIPSKPKKFNYTVNLSAHITYANKAVVRKKYIFSHRQDRSLADRVLPVAEPVLRLRHLERPRHRLPQRRDRVLVREAQGDGERHSGR